jgi:hypothetical protein
VGFALSLPHSSDSTQDAGGLLKIPGPQMTRKARLSPANGIDFSLYNQTSGLKKQTWSLRSLQYGFSEHPMLENFSF